MSIWVCFWGRSPIWVQYLASDELRIDSCDERRIYKKYDISGPMGGTYMFNTSPKIRAFPY